MSYRYLVLMDASRRWDSPHLPEIQAALRLVGMRERFTFGSIKIFLSEETPCQPLPGHGFVIGHLFAHNGSPINAIETFSTFSDSKCLRDHILDDCWGEYILVQPNEGQGAASAITRDPSGGVPCVYSICDGIGFITSNVSLAIQLGLYRKRIDWDFVAQCLTYPNVKTRRTALADVYELLPGSSLDIGHRNLTTRLSWSPWKFVEQEYRHTNLEDAAANVRHAVASVVGTWASIDESILVELSGGLDSSIVACCLKHSPAQVTCYNLSTPVPGADERHYASQVAAYLGVALRTEQLDLALSCSDVKPIPDAASPRMGILQYAVSRAMEAAAGRYRASSSYMGAGGDTVFGLLINASPAADAMMERGMIGGFSAIKDISQLHQCTMWKAARLTARKMMRGPKAASAPDRSFLNTELGVTPAEAHPWFDAPSDALPGDRERIVDLANNQLFRDIVYRGENRWIRMPLLSQPVVEACLRTPSWMAIAGGRNRSVARSAFADVLPQDVLNRRSKGSFVGYLGSLFRRNKGQIRHTLLSGSLYERGLLDGDALNRFLDAELPPRDKSFTRILSLFAVENWLQHQD